MSAERRKFTDEFAVGDEVSITRERHGWHDGQKSGLIASLSEYSCSVAGTGDDEGYLFEIRHPRDIRLVQKATAKTIKAAAAAAKRSRP